jgi:hypothetical protein
MSWNPENRFVSERLKRFYSLDDQMKAAYRANDFSAARKLAGEYLEVASVYRCNWNYGNAIHDANRYLGLIALRGGASDEAAVYLIKAGKSTGSPQLNTFGPELDLADALLKTGEIEAVKTYLKGIKRFWEMDNGQVSVWLSAIEKGETPDLNRFAKQPSTGQLLLYWFTLAWPLFMIAGFLYFLRQRLSRKWLFGVIGLVSAYLAMVATGWSIGYLMPKLLEGLDASNVSVIMGVVHAGMAATFVLSFLVVFGVSRFFVTKKEAS